MSEFKTTYGPTPEQVQKADLEAEVDRVCEIACAYLAGGGRSVTAQYVADYSYAVYCRLRSRVLGDV